MHHHPFSRSHPWRFHFHALVAHGQPGFQIHQFLRAERRHLGAQELVDLEAWLAVRDKGMKMETPGVRP